MRNPLHGFGFPSRMTDVPWENFACGIFLGRNAVQSLIVLNGEQRENKGEKEPEPVREALAPKPSLHT